MPTEYILYIPIVILVWAFLFIRARNKAFVSLFIVWLFGSPIFLNPRYTVSISFVGFDIQPNRLLFLVLTPVLFLLIMTPRRLKKPPAPSEPQKFRTFEVILVIFVLLMVFTIGMNIQSFSTRNAIADITNAIAFLAVYFCAKQFFSKEDFNLVKIGFLAFAIISATVALYQFLVNPNFFRLGDMRASFGGYYRSNGLFTAEYDQGIFMTLSIVVVMTTHFKLWMKIVFIAVLCAGGFVAMHRLTWVAILFTLGMIWFLYLRSNLLVNILLPLALFILILVALNIPWSQMALGRFGSNLVSERLLSDTVTIRFSQYSFSFYMMGKYPLGIGDYDNSLYYQEAYDHGLTFFFGADREAIAYVIHNGLLSAGVKYGILGLVLYSLFILTAIGDFLRESIREGKKWVPLLLVMSIFLIFNATNDFSFLGTQVSIALAWLLGGYMVDTRPEPVADAAAQPVINPSLSDLSTANGN